MEIRKIINRKSFLVTIPAYAAGPPVISPTVAVSFNALAFNPDQMNVTSVGYPSDNAVTESRAVWCREINQPLFIINSASTYHPGSGFDVKNLQLKGTTLNFSLLDSNNVLDATIAHKLMFVIEFIEFEKK